MHILDVPGGFAVVGDIEDLDFLDAAGACDDGVVIVFAKNEGKGGYLNWAW